MLAVAHHVDAADAAVLHHQRHERRLQPQRHLLLQHGMAQRADQALPQHQAAVALGTAAPAQVEPVAAHHAQHQPDPALGAGEQDVRLDLVHRDAAHQLRALVGAAQAVELGAEFCGVEIHRLHGAVARLAARLVRKVIRILLHRAEADAEAFPQEAHHAGRVAQIGLDARLRHAVADQALEVGQRLLVGIIAADAGNVLVAGNPDAAARHRAGAAVQILLLDHQRRQPLRLAAQRRGHAASAGTHHDDVVLRAGLLLVHTHAHPTGHRK